MFLRRSSFLNKKVSGRPSPPISAFLFFLLMLGIALFEVGCQEQPVKNLDEKSGQSLNLEKILYKDNTSIDNTAKDYTPDKNYQAVPQQWGETVSGVKTRLDTNDSVIALTLDACGGPDSSGYDQELIEYLSAENVSATLFINSRWIDANPETFLMLSQNPLFEIANHGYEHKPLSVNGRSAYGIKGTESIQAVIYEVSLNDRKIMELTGNKPKFFRPGTAYCDEIGVKIANDLGEEVVAFSILGDAGATFSKEQVKQALLKAEPGSIVIGHMNHPEKETAEGFKLAIPELKKRGFRFVKLSEYPLR